MDALTPNAPSALEAICSIKIRPRAIIFKANQKAFDKIRELIKSQFPDVEIVYVTTGPAACILRVTKSMPSEIQDSSTQTFYAVE